MKNLSDYIQKYPHRTPSLLGLDCEQLNQLLAELKRNEKERQAALEETVHRINAKGAGRPPRLTTDEQVYLCLTYLRHHPTFELLGLMFNVCKSEAHQTFHYWLAALRTALPASLFEEYLSDEEGWEMVQEVLEQQELLVDSTEQGRERPGDNAEQQQYYSGKKKRHTLKTQVITTDDGTEIADVVAGVPGPTADVTLLRGQQARFSAQQRFKGDKAYIGAERTSTPHKKPKGKALSEQQRAENRTFAQNRIFVEHLICRVKVFRVMQERFRLRCDKYSTVILSLCGLVRLKLGRIEFAV